MDEGDWNIVGQRGRFRSAKAGTTNFGADSSDLQAKAKCFTVEECLESLRSLQDGLRASALATSLRQAFQSLDSQSGASPCRWQQTAGIRCYGLGSPTASLDARAQLALVAVLIDIIGKGVQVSFYDPVLSDVDKQLLLSQGHSVLSVDEATQHTATSATLFYMPHCDASLYDDVLDKNWDPLSLSRIAFLGNSFAAMHERWCGPSFRRRAGKPTRVLALVDHGLVTEEPLHSAGFGVKTAFNDTSLHIFAADSLQSAPALFAPSTGTDL